MAPPGPARKTDVGQLIWILIKGHSLHLGILLDPIYELFLKCLVIHLCGDHADTQNAKLGLHDYLIHTRI